jgi:succinate dehydrogenase hydrophobic anchor subunit
MMAVRTDRSAAAPTGRRGGRGQTLVWWVTAVSGIGLLVLVGVHMVAHHFVVEATGGLRTYEQVLDYVANPLIFVLEVLFLLIVTVHAMLGLRSVLFDLAASDRARARISRGLVALGTVTIVYGLVLITVLASRA